MKKHTSDRAHVGKVAKAASGMKGKMGSFPGKKFAAEVGSPRVPKKAEHTERARNKR